MELRETGSKSIAMLRDMGCDGVQILRHSTPKCCIVIAAAGEQPGPYRSHPGRVIRPSGLPGLDRQWQRIQPQRGRSEFGSGQSDVINRQRCRQPVQTIEMRNPVIAILNPLFGRPDGDPWCHVPIEFCRSHPSDSFDASNPVVNVMTGRFAQADDNQPDFLLQSVGREEPNHDLRCARALHPEEIQRLHARPLPAAVGVPEKAGIARHPVSGFGRRHSGPVRH